MVSAQLATMIGRWCNGNTTGFGSVIPGSNPSRPTKESQSLFSDWLSFLLNCQKRNLFGSAAFLYDNAIRIKKLSL